MLNSVAQLWLGLQCRQITGASQGLVVLDGDDGKPAPAAVWPEGSTLAQGLAKTAQHALRQRRDMVLELRTNPGTERADYHQVACLVEIEGEVAGVVALQVRSGSAQPQSLLRLLKWGAAWFQLLMEYAESSRNRQLGAVLELVASSIEGKRFLQGGIAVATQLADRLQCEQVAIGFLDAAARHVSVQALSNNPRFDRRQNLIRAIERAMMEALDQAAVVSYPDNVGSLPIVVHAHEKLAQGQRCLCTVPMAQDQRPLGAITLIRSKDRPFDEEELAVVEHIAAVVGPILELRRREDRWLPAKVRDEFVSGLGAFLGPGRLLAKIGALLAALILGSLCLATGEYRVSADATLEGVVERSLVAPQDGFIAEALVRPGDVVEEDQLVARLDDKDLRLEVRKWASQRAQVQREYRQAMANQERSQLRVLRARIDQANAQLSLIDEQLARTELRAPFAGVVVSGDLSQALASPVERGQVLYKIAPLDDYRVILKVDERDIDDLMVGQRGSLALSAAPERRFDVTVERITPVSLAAEGRNVFEVEAQLEDPPAMLRPGMEGVAKVFVDQRRLIWIWTHHLIDWLRLKLWVWMR